MRIIHRPERPKPVSRPWVPAWWYENGTIVEKRGHYFEVVERYEGYGESAIKWMQIPTPEDRRWLK